MWQFDTSNMIVTFCIVAKATVFQGCLSFIILLCFVEAKLRRRGRSVVMSSVRIYRNVSFAIQRVIFGLNSYNEVNQKRYCRNAKINSSRRYHCVVNNCSTTDRCYFVYMYYKWLIVISNNILYTVYINLVLLTWVRFNLTALMNTITPFWVSAWNLSTIFHRWQFPPTSHQ